MKNMTINGIRCDTATAERVLDDPSPGHDWREWRRFDEAIFRTPEGWWFVVRPLDHDEAREWLARVDEIEARRRFPDTA